MGRRGRGTPQYLTLRPGQDEGGVPQGTYPCQGTYSPSPGQDRGVPTPCQGIYPWDRTAYRVLDMLQSVCLLHSRRRTFLLMFNFTTWVHSMTGRFCLSIHWGGDTLVSGPRSFCLSLSQVLSLVSDPRSFLGVPSVCGPMSLVLVSGPGTFGEILVSGLRSFHWSLVPEPFWGYPSQASSQGNVLICWLGVPLSWPGGIPDRIGVLPLARMGVHPVRIG